MALKSKTLPVLVAATLCLAALRGLAFVGAATASDAEGSVSKPFVSPMALTKFIAFYYGFQFLFTYFLTPQAMKAYFKEPMGDKAEKVAQYLMKTTAQNMFPMFVWSVITVNSGTVSKEYMLVCLVQFCFCTLDIARMTTTCEGIGVPKSMIMPYVPFCMVMAYLAYAAWASM